MRSRGRQELSRALTDRGFGRDAVRQALGRLEQEGLLDDLAAARSAVRLRGDKYGARRLERELLARGFSREIVREALSDQDPEREEAALARALTKAWKSGVRLPALARRRRAIDSLARRGFSAARVSEMIDRFENSDEVQRGPRTLS